MGPRTVAGSPARSTNNMQRKRSSSERDQRFDYTRNRNRQDVCPMEKSSVCTRSHDTHRRELEPLYHRSDNTCKKSECDRPWKHSWDHKARQAARSRSRSLTPLPRRPQYEVDSPKDADAKPHTLLRRAQRKVARISKLEDAISDTILPHRLKEGRLRLPASSSQAEVSAAVGKTAQRNKLLESVVSLLEKVVEKSGR
eukprot:TRINITY_DN75298_c0_g1_i1.p1 TRINITY_DN75298_c0_g1~~TRINITY_DN75298_c0_g1_i1.p1  ORF type:complete len:198 (-),score=25.34 TRINITY_DN75298_c0_g1_i1:148-741(-)